MPRFSSNHTPPGYLKPRINPDNPRDTTNRAQRYQNTITGATISRREYLNMQAQTYGWNNLGEYQRFSRAAGGLGGMHTDAAKLAIGMMINAKMDVIDRSEFIKIPANRQILRDLVRNPNDMAWNGPLGRWLTAIGLREPGWTFDVGDTPRKQKRA